MAMAEQPDLILMDMLLPEMNGWEVAAEIRKREAGKPVPIIAVTAQAMSGDENVALEAGCNAYVSKPIDEDELLEKIVELIEAFVMDSYPAIVCPVVNGDFKAQ